MRARPGRPWLVLDQAGSTPQLQQDADDEPAPLGQWESTGAKGVVRIEHCGTALCGYALTEASTRGESVLVNMKPKSDGVWTGNIYSRSSGNTYYAKMTFKQPDTLRVEACAIGSGHTSINGSCGHRLSSGRTRSHWLIPSSANS